nr:hypothetical protein [Candidatus Woesearchaeota archaeon]
MKKQSWNLVYGNKGFAFILDVALAILLVILMLAASNIYIFKNTKDTSSNLQLSKTGSDVVTVLDNTKELDTLNKDSIEDSISGLIPENYGYRFNISWQKSGSQEMQSFEIGSLVPNDKFVATGKKFFLVTSIDETNITDYGSAKYWIWLK